MRIFGSERMDGMLQKLGLQEGEAIVHPWINRALEKAQQKVEARNFDIRKNLLKFDDVMNDQRKAIFDQRIELMSQDVVTDTINEMRHEVIETLVTRHIPERAYPEQWDTAGLHDEILDVVGLDLPIADWAKEEGIAEEEVRERIMRAGDETGRLAHRPLLAGRHAPDREGGAAADPRPSVARASGRARPSAPGDRLPRLCPARPADRIQDRILRALPGPADRLREAVTRQIMHIEIVQRPPPLAPEGDFEAMQASHPDPVTGEDEMFDQPPGDGRQQPVRNARYAAAAGAMAAQIDPNDPATWGKVPRNAPCPCGSGKKYKHCHGRLA